MVLFLQCAAVLCDNVLRHVGEVRGGGGRVAEVGSYGER